MKWLKFTVSTTTEGSELVAYVLENFGSEGVSVQDDNDFAELLKNHKNWDYVDAKLLKSHSGRALVSGYFPENYDTAALCGELCALGERSEFPMGSLETVCTLIDSHDWENEWRKYYAPIKAGRTVIVPAWQKYTASADEIPVYIEPGMAFGTGSHETTAMCIELMQQTDIAGKKVADVGCGSGILGAVALSLGAQSCVFNDIDEQAVKAAEENLKLNGFGEYKIICGDLDVGNEKFDVVLANLTADLLIRLKGKLSSICAPGGRIIISGIINARADEIKKIFSCGMTHVRTCKRGEWQAMMFEMK